MHFYFEQDFENERCILLSMIKKETRFQRMKPGLKIKKTQAL